MRDSLRLKVTRRYWDRRLLTVRDSWLLWKCTGASVQGRAQTTDTSKESSTIFREVRTHHVVTEGDYVEIKTVYEAKQGEDWDQWHRALKDDGKALQDNKTWNLVGPPTDMNLIPDVIPGSTKQNCDPVVKPTNGKHSRQRSIGKQRKNTLISEPQRQTKRGLSHSRPRVLRRNNARAFPNVSMQTLKNSSRVPLETSDSTKRTRGSGSEDLEKLGWITFSSGETEEARQYVHSQYSVQTRAPRMHPPISTGQAENNFLYIFRAQNF